MKSIDKQVVTEIIIEKSRFICYLVPINSNDYALSVLDTLKSTYKDANHHCYAIVANGQSIQKYSDDGEPNKTAGYVILQALLMNELDNVICVVIRYFGGIKLGAGGLIRAYNASAMNSINNAKLSNIIEGIKTTIIFSFEYINNIDTYLNKINVEITNKDYFDTVTYNIKFPANKKDEIVSTLINLTKNTIIIEDLIPILMNE